MFKLFHGESSRFQHFCALGVKKTGKSTLLGNMALNDIERGEGVILFDNQGALANSMIEKIKVPRRDIYYLDCTHKFYPMGFNIFEIQSSKEKEKKKEKELIDSYSHKLMEGYLGEIEDENFNKFIDKLIQTAIEISLTPREFFEALKTMKMTEIISKRLDNLSKELQDFWKKDLKTLRGKIPEELSNKVNEKIKPLLGEGVVKKLTEERVSIFNLFDLIKKGKVVIINVPEEELGEVATKLLLELVILKLITGIRLRDEFEYSKKPLYVYLNEFPYFESSLLEEVIEECLKNGEEEKVSLNITKESRGELYKQFALVEYSRVMVFFRLQEDDAEYICKHHLKEAYVNPDDLVSLKTAQVILYLLNENEDRIVMQATTTPMPEMKQLHNYQAILERSLKARSRGLIELARSMR